jgi:hypothetical protein
MRILLSSQPRHRHGLSVPLAHRHRRISADDGMGCDIANDAAADGNLRLSTDGNVVADDDSAPYHDKIFDRRAPSDPDMACQNAPDSKVHVMGDLHAVIDLASIADAGVPQRAAIHGASGPDFHIVADDHPAQLRHAQQTSRRLDEPEPWAPDCRIGKHVQPVACHRVADRHVRPDRAARPQRHTCADYRIRPHVTALSEPHLRLDDGARFYPAARADGGLPTDDCLRRNPRGER